MDKAGKCPMCGKDMTKMKAYVCEKCLKEADKTGNCDK
jgi:predicted amidophosphoribosyltransferase